MSPLTGTGGLIRLILRRDRVILPIWVFWMSVMPVFTTASFRELYPDESKLAAFAQTMTDNPSLTALYGPVYSPTVGGLVAWRMSLLIVVLGIISALVVIRHTRTEEEAGRRELIGATVIGRHAGMAAALIVTILADLVVGAVVALTMAASDVPVAGSVAFGVQLAAFGILFAAAAAFGAQLTEGAGSARAILLGAIGVTFVLRMVGNLSGEDGPLHWLVQASPLGWVQELRAFADERWWVLAPVGGLAVVLIVVAVVLQGRRDIAAGLLPTRLGPANAAPGLRSPFALAWRLHRGLLLGWVIGFAVFGSLFGSLGETVNDMLEESPELAQIMAALGGANTLTDMLFGTLFGLMGLIASTYAIQAALRWRAEETNLRAEPVLATAVGRVSYALSHIVFSLLGSGLAVMVGGLGAGIVQGTIAGDAGHWVPRLLGAAAIQLPAVWMLSALTVALIGLAPNASSLSWGALGAIFVISFFGPILGLEQWVLDISPFTHLPKLPGGEVTAAPLLWLGGVLVALLLAGLAGFRRRDVI
ncbi:MAG: ABC transporter permease [Streptosporangiales bacterium]|nr:ABC transporter permease [Streptosporangiales bacterium]